MFAEGELKESFLQGWLKFDRENYYVHANHFDFKEEKPDLVERNTVKDNKKSRSKTASPKSKEASPKKKRLRKVTTPGCGSSVLDKGFLENNSSAEEERRRRVGKEGERNPRDPLLFGGHKKLLLLAHFWIMDSWTSALWQTPPPRRKRGKTNCWK